MTDTALTSAVSASRALRGKTNYYAGRAAETRIEELYVSTGHRVLARRWRGRSGEIDLVVQKDDVVAFVEVKHAASLARAAESLRPAQTIRIARAAEEFLATQPNGNLTDCTFEAALVDGTGRCEIIENAFDLH